jgi:hypothetical protein
VTVTGITPAAAAALSSLRLVAQATEAPPAGRPAANFKFTREILVGRLPAADSDSDSDSDLNDGPGHCQCQWHPRPRAGARAPGHGKGFPRRRPACLCQPPASSTSNRDLPWS